jgi:hypothetical protein
MSDEAANPRSKRPILLWFAYFSPVPAILVGLAMAWMTVQPTRPSVAVLDQIFFMFLAASVAGLLMGIAGLFGAAANGIGSALVAVLGILLNGLSGFATVFFAAMGSIRC